MTVPPVMCMYESSICSFHQPLVFLFTFSFYPFSTILKFTIASCASTRVESKLLESSTKNIQFGSSYAIPSCYFHQPNGSTLPGQTPGHWEDDKKRNAAQQWEGPLASEIITTADNASEPNTHFGTSSNGWVFGHRQNHHHRTNFREYKNKPEILSKPLDVYHNFIFKNFGSRENSIAQSATSLLLGDPTARIWY